MSHPSTTFIPHCTESSAPHVCLEQKNFRSPSSASLVRVVIVPVPPGHRQSKSPKHLPVNSVIPRGILRRTTCWHCLMHLPIRKRRLEVPHLFMNGVVACRCRTHESRCRLAVSDAQFAVPCCLTYVPATGFCRTLPVSSQASSDGYANLILLDPVTCVRWYHQIKAAENPSEPGRSIRRVWRRVGSM